MFVNLNSKEELDKLVEIFLKMSRFTNYKDVEDARAKLHESICKHVDEISTQTTFAKVKGPMVESLTEVASATSYALSGVKKLRSEVSDLAKKVPSSDELSNLKTTVKDCGNLVTLNNTAVDSLKNTLDTETGKIKQALDKGSRRAEKALDNSQKNQLAKSEYTLIVRGVPYATDLDRKETYFELKEVLLRSFAQVGCRPLQFWNIKRLQASRESKERKMAPSIRVTMAGVEEKLTLFRALEDNAARGKRVTFSVTHEIPKYAISSYKFCQTLAAIVREQSDTIRTRVYIPPGRQWPTIFVRNGKDSKFMEITQTDFKRAKECNSTRTKTKAANRKAARSDGRSNEVGN